MNTHLKSIVAARDQLDLGPSDFTALHIAGLHVEACRCSHCLVWWKVMQDAEHDMNCPFRPDELEDIKHAKE